MARDRTQATDKVRYTRMEQAELLCAHSATACYVKVMTWMVMGKGLQSSGNGINYAV